MSGDIAADPAALRRPAFAPYSSHMKSAADRFADSIAASTPAVPTVRGETDTKIQKMVTDGTATAEALVKALVQIASGDQQRLAAAADLFEKIEQANTEAAKALKGTS